MLVHVIDKEELRVGEWLVLKQTVNIQNLPPPPPKGSVFTYHLAVVQGSLGFVGAVGAAAPALPVAALQRGFADLED